MPTVTFQDHDPSVGQVSARCQALSIADFSCSTLAMPRPKREDFPGARHHVMRQGGVGNPARIAAPHALVLDAGLTHCEVAQQLAMTQVEVRRCLAKVEECRPDQVRLAEILATIDQWRG